MLKSKVFHDGVAFPTEQGTPQGGTLSPLLANVALTALDEFCLRFGWQAYNKEGRYIVNPIVRFADDFVVVCQSQRQAELIKQEIAEFLKQQIGLDLSEEKTKITHICKGFDFLGFTLRKHWKPGKRQSHAHSKPNPQRQEASAGAKTYRWENHKLLVNPQKQKVTQLLSSCKEKLKSRGSCLNRVHSQVLCDES